MKLYKDYAVLAGGQVVGKFVTFLAFAWLARVLDPEGYGAVEYVVGLTVFFATLVDGGLGVVGVRRAAQHRSELPGLAVQIPLARMMLAAGAVPVMMLMAATVTNAAAPAMLVGLFAASLLTIPWRQEWLFQATERMTEAAIAQVVRAVVFAAAVFVLVRHADDLVLVGWAEIGAVAAMTAYCIAVQHLRITPWRLAGSIRGFAGLLREGAAVGTTNIAWTLNQYAPLFLIATLAGGLETGWFAAAARVTGSLLIFSNLYHFSLYPAVTRAIANRDAGLAGLLAASCRVTAWAGIFAGLALTLLAEPVMVVALGEKMASAAPLLQVMAWMLPVALCSGHARWLLVAAGAQTRVLRSQLAGLAATLAGCIVLAPMPGGLGYAIAALAGMVVVWMVSHFFAARRGFFPPPFHSALKPALLAAAIVAANHVLASGPWFSLAGLVLYAGAAPLLDRGLLRDLSMLGNAKRDLDGTPPN